MWRFNHQLVKVNYIISAYFSDISLIFVRFYPTIAHWHSHRAPIPLCDCDAPPEGGEKWEGVWPLARDDFAAISSKLQIHDLIIEEACCFTFPISALLICRASQDPSVRWER